MPTKTPMVAVAEIIGLSAGESVHRPLYEWAIADVQLVEALGVPAVILLLGALVLVILGGVIEIPALTVGRRRRWSVVRLSRDNTLAVRATPDYDATVIYRYSATATGLLAVGKPQGSFVPVDCPHGTGFVDTAYLTGEVDLDQFISDERPTAIVKELAAALDTGADIRRLISPNGLLVATTDRPLLIPTNHLIGKLDRTASDTETAAVALQIDMFEELRQALLDLAEVSPKVAHSQSALIPTELWNFPYLAIAAPGHSPWLIHFEYHRGEPFIAGVSLDV